MVALQLLWTLHYINTGVIVFSNVVTYFLQRINKHSVLIDIFFVEMLCIMKDRRTSKLLSSCCPLVMYYNILSHLKDNVLGHSYRIYQWLRSRETLIGLNIYLPKYIGFAASWHDNLKQYISHSHIHTLFGNIVTSRHQQKNVGHHQQWQHQLVQ